MPPNPPPSKEPKPGVGQYYAKVSSEDPLAGSALDPIPSKNFDFIMQSNQKAPRKMFPGLPKPALLLLAAVGLFFVVLIAFSLLFGNKTSNADKLIDVAARAQEISRVSELVQRQTTDGDTRDLATTVNQTLASQEKQIMTYLKSRNIKTEPKKLAARLDKKTDSSLASALQNNNYDQTYFGYLKVNLTNYQTALGDTYKGATKNARSILSAAFDSTKTTLSAPQLK